MQSHGESQLVAELPQWLKKQQAHRDSAETSPRGRWGQLLIRAAAGGQLLIRSVGQSPEIDSRKFVADEPLSRQKGGDTIAARKDPRRCPSCGFPLLEHARKIGVNKYQK
jgi:hypothetical protein